MVVWGGLGVWNLYGHGISLFNNEEKANLELLSTQNYEKKLDCFKNM